MNMQFMEYETLYFFLLDITLGPEADEQFHSLPECLQALYITAIFDMEIQNGGLCQFFVNCGSTYAAKITESLHVIGLEPMEVLYKSFLSDHQIDSSDLSSFQSDSIDNIIAQYERYPYDSFDSAYIDLWDALDFNEVMLQYANAHSEALMQQ